MKFCGKCGKEIMDEAVVCPNCGCAVQPEKAVKEVSYDDCVTGASKTNVIAGVILAVGVVCWLFVNMWIGAILCLAAELVALVPNSKLQKAMKQNVPNAKTKEGKVQMKAIVADMKKKYSAYSFSKILAIIALALLIIFIAFV